MEDNDNSWVKSDDSGIAKQMLNEAIPSGTIVYPEVECLRYVIAEQKKEIRRLADWNNELRDLLELALSNSDGIKKRTIEDNIDAGIYSDWSKLPTK